MTSSTSTSQSKLRLVCPHCGSADFREEAVGHCNFDVTYYADGTYDVRSDEEWETDTWTNFCHGCRAYLRFDQLVEEGV
jgi:hypothetical protein